MNKPVVIVAFDPDDAPTPASRLADTVAAKLVERFPELMNMQPWERRAEIDRIFDSHR